MKNNSDLSYKYCMDVNGRTACANNRNYGVFGIVSSSVIGTGIYGSNAGIASITGNYAGYFSNPVYVTGTITAPEHLTISDAALKENIVPLSESEETSSLGNILAKNMVKYNYKSTITEDVELDADLENTELKDASLISQKNHYGLLAQELQEIYPDLVTKGQDGYLAVNYVELVPIMIQSIQEMQREIDELRGSGNSSVMMSKSMTGKQLKRISVTTGMDSIKVNGSELGAGIFLYTLIVNGQEIDTKRMVLSK